MPKIYSFNPFGLERIYKELKVYSINFEEVLSEFFPKPSEISPNTSGILSEILFQKKSNY